MLFSQRQGLKPVKQTIQLDYIDDDLRIALWNVLAVYYWEHQDKSLLIIKDRYLDYESPLLPLLRVLWHSYFRKPLDSLGIQWDSTYKFLRDYFFKCNWYEVYDFIDFIAENDNNLKRKEDFIVFCNYVLEKEISAYRFVDGLLRKISSEEEIESIEEAIRNSDNFSGVSIHLKTALNLLADRKAPDYRNSIKESISAVESACMVITGDSAASLGNALKTIENKLDIQLHPALTGAFNKLYGYTSDSEGIRHALLEESNIKFEDAKFMLVSCSAFVNYLIDKSKG